MDLNFPFSMAPSHWERIRPRLSTPNYGWASVRAGRNIFGAGPSTVLACWPRGAADSRHCERAGPKDVPGGPDAGPSIILRSSGR